jgi:PAS domain S-box-containing protein
VKANPPLQRVSRGRETYTGLAGHAGMLDGETAVRKQDWIAEFEALKRQRGTAPATRAPEPCGTLCSRLVESVKEFAIFMIDPNGVILTWNAGAERIKQYRADEVLGRNFRMLYTPDDQAAGRPEKNLRDVLKHGQTEDIGWRMKKDGSWFWADAVLTTVLDESGKLVGFAKVIRDLSDINMAEQQARDLEQTLRMERLRDQFLSLVSHELRTPLTAILGFAALLSENEQHRLTPEQDQYARSILSATEDLTHQVNNLIDLTTLQAGKLNLEPAPMNFSEIVLGAMHAVQPKAQAKHLWFANHVTPDLPEMVGDPARIAQVLITVLGNAIKFAPSGGRIDIRAAVDDGFLRCEVADTGPGISAEDLEKLFKPFSQADMSATRRHGGLGIGLSISKTLVEAHGGHIGVISAPGKGSTFWFTLPVDGRALSPDAESRAQAPAASGRGRPRRDRPR